MDEILGRTQGWAGWSPVPGIADRGADKVMVIADFVGGEDNKPTSEIGKYVGIDGLVDDIEDAVALPKGARGDKAVINTTSITSNAIGAGAKTFILVTPIDLVVGQIAKAYSLADPNNYVCGYIFSITPTEIVITVSETGGSGSKSDWVIVLSAFQGKQGISTTNMAAANRLLGKGAGQSVPSSPSELEAFGITIGATRLHSGVEQTTNPAITIDNPPSGIYTPPGANQTGAIRIKLPATGEAIFYKIYISLYEHTGKTPSNFVLSAYTGDFASGFDAVMYGGINARKVAVRGYNDSGVKYIYIGETNTVWNYSKAVIQRVEGYFSGATFDLVAKNWEITLQTSFLGTLAWTVTDPRASFNPNQILSEYNAASGVNIALTNAMSLVQMFQNLQKQTEDRYTKAETNGRYATLPPVGPTLSSILVGDVRGTNPLPGTDRQRGVWFEFKNSADMGLVSGNTYSAVTTFIPWADNSGNHSSAHRLASSAGSLWYQSYATGVWGSWYRLLDNRGSSSNLILGDGTPKPLSDFILATQKGYANGVVPLNASTLIDQVYLPSYVDDIIEGYKSGASFYKEVGLTTVITGETGKIYVDLTTGQNSKQYRWSGSAYIQITNGLIASTNDVPEGGSNLYFTVARVLATVISGFSAAAGVVANTDTILQAINKIVGNIAALQTAIDAKVADNLTASTTVAPSKTAVNTALALKADIAASTGTLVALTFTSDSVQGTIASPLTGNITCNITGAKLGVVTLVIHNHTTAPTFDSKYKKLSGSGSYVIGAINYIFCEYINDTEIIYSINQRT